MEFVKGEKIRIVYTSRNRGKHFVHGLVTKEPYGYRAAGDQFEVYLSDIKARPDLFRPVDPSRMEPVSLRTKPTPKPKRVPLKPVPDPPPPPEPISIAKPELEIAKDEGWRMAKIESSVAGLTARAYKVLGENNIITLGDLSSYSKEELLAIKGIGEKTADALLAGLEKLSG